MSTPAQGITDASAWLAAITANHASDYTDRTPYDYGPARDRNPMSRDCPRLNPYDWEHPGTFEHLMRTTPRDTFRPLNP